MTPTFLTHYHLRDRPPFQSISDLTHEEWTIVCKDLTKRRETDPTYNRRFGLKYREVRIESENILREKFKAKGGLVSRQNPHYFCLGVSNWWKNFCNHSEIRLPLKNIDPKTLSFTYPDSFTSMGMLKKFGIKHELRPYHGKVFFLHELQNLIREIGIPADKPVTDFSEYQHDDLEIYIEAQLWTDTPLANYLKQSRKS